MTHQRQPVRSLGLVLLVKFRISLAFSFGFGGIATYTHSTRHISCPRQRALFVSEGHVNGDVNTHHGNESRKNWAHRLQRSQNSRRCRRVKPDELRTTAAGAEPLFSPSLWPLSFSNDSLSFAATRNDENPRGEVDLADLGDLPPIDCEWACRSDEEIILLRRMKLSLDSEMKVAANADLRLSYPDVYGDLRLLRFLRKNKKADVASSSARYRSFLKWREENDVDKIRAMVESDPDGESSFVPPDDGLRRVATYFPMKFDYVTGSSADPGDDGSFEGNSAVPTAVLYVGSFDTFGISEEIKASESNVSLDDFLNYWIYLYESIHFHLYQQSVRYGEMMFLDEVCDLSGLSLQQFSPYFVAKVMKPWLRMTQSNYPETTRRIYVLKPPTIVNLAWNLVTPLLSQGTVDKIRFEKKFKGTADDFCKSID